MLDLYFLTTNRVKFEHLSFLLKDQPVRLQPPPEYGKPYHEPRIFDRDQLLKKSVESANSRLFRKGFDDDSASGDLFRILGGEYSIEDPDIADLMQDRFFIIEDTSVRIEALSYESEFPGVDVKYWMRSTSFTDLDRQLKGFGNNRDVEVRSDIVLYIPKRFRSHVDNNYIVFTGVTQGRVVTEELDFETNPLYPWLDNKTFNKWFVPSGAKDIFSRLPIVEALEYDFRQIAIEKMLSFLYERNLLDRPKPKIDNLGYQESLFGEPDFIVCGPTCSGKSTISEYLAEKYGYFHIEASDYMHLLYYRRFVSYTDKNEIHNFAKSLLEQKPEIVANEIKKERNNLGSRRYVISGFRSPAELRPFQNEIRAGVIKLVYLKSARKIRFERNKSRARADALETYHDFLERDALQFEMGLRDLEKDRRAHLVFNELSLEEFKLQFVKGFLEDCPEVSKYDSVSELVIVGSLEDSIICSLFINQQDFEFYTTTEITRFVNRTVVRTKKGEKITTHKDNVSRYFNMGFYPYFRISMDNGKRKYRLSATGLSKAREILRLSKV
ncbi:non-canonical purine NTP pyrophosphatase [Marinobacter sp.]|uniref:non-canonical purine NTP pyrophosphatase n=1 Tax=Marinobacter sp. TaxID=50741 RepID=UPI003561A537